MKTIILLILVYSNIVLAQTFIKGNNLIEVPTTTATAAGTTTLTSASKKIQEFTGSTTQTVVLPDATTLQVGQSYYIANKSTGTVTVNFNGGGLARTIKANNQYYFVLITNAIAAGTWDVSQYSIDLASQVTGNLSVNNLNSGTSASSTTYWSGAGTWTTPAGSEDQGTLCGITVGATNIATCKGNDPSSSCPSGYTRIFWTTNLDGNYYTCTHN